MTDVCRRKNEKGQSLIELLVAIGLGMVIVGSLVSLGNANTRRATQSRQENQATKLAQEGAEIVRNIRDTNLAGSVRMGSTDTGPCASSPYCTWDQLYNAYQDSVPGQVSTSCIANQWCLRGGTETGLLGIFSRNIIIEDFPTDTDGLPATPNTICADAVGIPPKEWWEMKRVITRVTWNTPTGTNTRQAVTCLSPKHRQ